MNAYAAITEDPREALKDGLEKVRAGMLGCRARPSTCSR